MAPYKPKPNRPLYERLFIQLIIIGKAGYWSTSNGMRVVDRCVPSGLGRAYGASVAAATPSWPLDAPGKPLTNTIQQRMKSLCNSLIIPCKSSLTFCDTLFAISSTDNNLWRTFICFGLKRVLWRNSRKGLCRSLRKPLCTKQQFYAEPVPQKEPIVSNN